MNAAAVCRRVAFRRLAPKYVAEPETKMWVARDRQDVARSAALPRMRLARRDGPPRSDSLGMPVERVGCRATHNPDEVRNPSCLRRSVRTSARRLVRGVPSVAEFADQWPGVQATRRPAIAFSGGGPHAEPVESRSKFVSLRSDLRVHACEVQYPEPSRRQAGRPSRWQCVANRLAGRQVSASSYPPRALGLGRDELEGLVS